MIVDQFDEMLASADQPVVMSVVLHSFIYGQPFRLRAISEALKHIVRQSDAVWLTTPGAIYADVITRVLTSSSECCGRGSSAPTASIEPSQRRRLVRSR
jgi:hypothetical protein